jgi:phage FluMu protein Com
MSELKEIRCPHCDWLNLKASGNEIEIKDRKFFLKVKGVIDIAELKCRRCGLLIK